MSERRFLILGELTNKSDFKKFKTKTFLLNFTKTRPKGRVLYLYARKGEFNTANKPTQTQYVVTETELKTLPEDMLIGGSRLFCRKMANLRKEGRYFSEAQILNFAKSDNFIKYGLNHFENAGGFFNDNGVIKNSCRHIWISFVEV